MAEKETLMFKVTKPCLTLFVAGGICAALAACSSSSSSSAPAASSAASAANSAASAVSSAASAISSAASAASSAASSGVSAADCVIIKQVSGSAITTLAPLQSDTPAQATAALKTYVTQLQADQAKLTSAQGKSVLSAWTAAVQKASTESTADATTTITGALAPLEAACP